jgi:thymidylate kinase
MQLLAGILAKRLSKQKGSTILLSGGTVIAIVGADATGKSTTVSETSRWLRQNFVIHTIHTGKPPATLLTIPINVLLALHRRLKSRSTAAEKSDQDFSTNQVTLRSGAKGLNSFIYAIRAVSLAWDRAALLRKARRACANGEMVLCDRYPTHTTGLMDSPRLIEDPSPQGWLASSYNRLARIERELYRQIPPPDIVIKLWVSIETAKKRNAAREIGDDETYLHNRHQQAREWFMPGTRCIEEVDTEPPLEETLRTIKQAIWSAL